MKDSRQNCAEDISSLLDWFASNQRSLPWRENRHPYAVWISEVMLQQTRVEAVIPYFLRWMVRFPTVHSLAAASIEEVIKLWEGLGYYTRARALHRGAQYIVSEHQGRFDPLYLDHIPGVGPYTKAAILNLAFRIPTPALDGNVLRVLARYWAVGLPIERPSTRRILAERLAPYVYRTGGWQVSEAMIELGALICTSRNPRCSECPLRRGCDAHEHQQQEVFPTKRIRPAIEKQEAHVAVVLLEDRLLIRQVPSGARMADLYEFPVFLSAESPWTATKIIDLVPVIHSFTRYRVTLYPTLYRVASSFSYSDYQWVQIARVNELPFSAGHRKIWHQCKDRVHENSTS